MQDKKKSFFSFHNIEAPSKKPAVCASAEKPPGGAMQEIVIKTYPEAGARGQIYPTGY